MKRIFLILSLVLLACSSCSSKSDEKRARELVEEHVPVSGKLTIRKLGGGFSGSNIFLATDGSKYVVKMIKSPKWGAIEIFNSLVASDGEYGPKVFFSDPKEGVLISEYLQGKNLTLPEIQSDQFCTILANLLKKIHHGKNFQTQFPFDLFLRIHRYIERNGEKCENVVPLKKALHIVDTIHEALKPHFTSVPCHNDLNRGNLIYLGNELKAIDFADASQGDSFYDIATVAFSFSLNPHQEKLLLTTYLGKAPSAKEKAKLYLFKQLLLIKSACDKMGMLSKETLQNYPKIALPPLDQYIEQVLNGRIDFSKPEMSLLDFKMLFTYFLENSNSQEFKDALETLNH